MKWILTILCSMVLAGLHPTGAGAGEMLSISSAGAGEAFTWPHMRHESTHFLILHDADEQEAAWRAYWLERTHHWFFETFDPELFDLSRPEHKLVCLLFSEPDIFADYAQYVDRMDMRWSKGYYSSRTNRIALFGNGTSDADWEPRMATADVDTSELSPDWHGRWGRPSMIAPTTHEAAHQLAFNTGLQRRGVMYPLWISEGLAASFEANANDPQAPFGPEYDNPVRRSYLRQAYEQGNMASLYQFVSMIHVPADDADQMDAVYAQAWGLFRFLYIHRRDALAEYLRMLKMQRPGPRTYTLMREEFAAAFGDLEELERQWHRDMLNFPTDGQD